MQKLLICGFLNNNVIDGMQLLGIAILMKKSHAFVKCICLVMAFVIAWIMFADIVLLRIRRRQDIIVVNPFFKEKIINYNSTINTSIPHSSLVHQQKQNSVTLEEGKKNENLKDNEVTSGMLSTGIPIQNVLHKMTLEEMSEIYHRYMNTLQVLCPVKEIFGGVRNGYSVCAPLKEPEQKHCSVFLVSLKESLNPALKEIKQDYGCDVQQFEARQLQIDLQSKMVKTSSLIIQIATSRAVDALIIDADDSSSVVLRQMLSLGFLRNVTQIVVHLHTTNDNTSASEYIQQLLLMRNLYIEGFRIHTYRRMFECTYKVNIWRTGCYVLSMMRMIPTYPPIVIPTSEKLNVSPYKALEKLYHQYMISTQVLCRNIVRLGHIMEGGWDVCNDTEYRPSSNCLVYSFGIATDWSFDDEVARRYGCEVHSFDPTIGLRDHKRSKNVHFHSIGLGGQDNPNNKDFPISTLQTIKEKLGHKKKYIDILKADIEFNEWTTLPNLLRTGVLRYVRQLHLETHHRSSSDRKKYIEVLAMCKGLYDEGFRLYLSNPNRHEVNLFTSKNTRRKLTAAYEIYFLNINLKT